MPKLKLLRNIYAIMGKIIFEMEMEKNSRACRRTAVSPRRDISLGGREEAPKLTVIKGGKKLDEAGE